MKKIRERFSLSANKAGFILACTLIPFSMINGAAQSSTVTSGTEVKDVVADLKESETIVLPPQAAGTNEPVEFHAADKEPAEKKNVYENSGKEATDLEAANSLQTKAQDTVRKEETVSSQSQTAPAQTGASSGQTTTIVEPPYTTTKVTTETVTTKTVTTETRTTESSITSGPGLPAEERIDGPLAPVQEKHSWDTPSTKTAPAAPKPKAQEKKDSEKKQEPEANLKIKETEPKKKPAPKQQTTKPAPKQTEQKPTEAKPAAPKQPAQNTKPAAPKENAGNKAPAENKKAPASNTSTAKPAPVTTEAEAAPAQKEPQKEEKKQKALIPAQDEKPSRSVTVKNSQYLDVIYPGSGWIYLGEKDANDLMRYYGRKVTPDGEETTFTLKATKSGSTVLHFYKNDALAGKFIEDYLAVTVSTESERDTHVRAPNYANYVPKGQRGINTASAAETEKAPEKATERPAQAENKGTAKIAASSSTGTAIERSSGSTIAPQEQRTTQQTQSARAASGDLLKKAQQEYDAKQYAECLATIQEFYKNADESKMDQALYLEARALEAPSPSRNIKSALHTYQTLVNRYPQSSLWEAANNRITYIQRMYIDIR